MTPQDLEARLKVPTWFSSPRFTAGIPRGAFIVLVMGSLFYGLVIAWWLGLIAFIVIYAPLVKAHRSDPDALRVWIYSLTRGTDDLSLRILKRLPITLE